MEIEEKGVNVKGGEETGVEVKEEIGAEERVFVASQWRLIWWKFRKHKLAILGGVILAIFYIVAIFWIIATLLQVSDDPLQ